jgi:uncharacterized membrane protein YphA (DoxX/SURF4 family)
MPFIAILDRWHAAVRRQRWLQRFTAMTRVLLAVSFIPPGLIKVFDMRFTRLSPDTPIGYFFDALYQSGAYYNFIGWAQVIAGVLMLLPPTATLGAVMFFPIILNIAIITPSLQFTGTPVITTLMLLAALYLLAWDYDRLKPLLPRREPHRHSGWREYGGQATAWALLGALSYGVLALLRVANLHELGALGLALATIGGALFGLTIALHLRWMPRDDAANAQHRASPERSSVLRTRRS